MKQSTVIFGSILAAFIVYITIRGQLRSYIAIFTGGEAKAKETVEAKTNEAIDKAFGTSKDIASKLPESLNLAIADVFSNMGLG